MSDEQLFTISEAAEFAQCHSNTIHAWIKKGLPMLQAGPGARILIQKTELVSFLRAESDRIRKEAEAEQAERKAKQEAKRREGQQARFREQLVEKLHDRTRAEFSDAGRKDFARKWDGILAEAMPEIEAKAIALDEMIVEHRKTHPKDFAARTALGHMEVPPALQDEFKQAWKSKLADIKGETKQPVVESAESARLHKIGGTTSPQPKQEARKLVARKFESLVDASAAISAHLNEPKSFTSLSRAQEFWNDLVANSQN